MAGPTLTCALGLLLLLDMAVAAGRLDGPLTRLKCTASLLPPLQEGSKTFNASLAQAGGASPKLMVEVTLS